MQSHQRQTLERWECDMERIRTKNRECIGQRRQGRCHPRNGTAVSAKPLPLELAHPEEQHAGQYDALRLLSSRS